MVDRLQIKDGVQEWIDKINDVLDLGTTDGFFRITNDWNNTNTLDLTGGKVRVSQTNYETVPSATVTVPLAQTSIVGANLVNQTLEVYEQTQTPDFTFVPIYLVETSANAITSVEDLRTWAVAMIDALPEAPDDGEQYVRKNRQWSPFQSTATAWGDITGTLGDQTDLDNRFTSVEDGLTQLESDTNTALNSLQEQVEAVEPIITTTSVNKTLVNTEKCFTTVAGLTITLPATPTEGYIVSVGVQDYTDTVVARNGSNIMGLAEDMTITKQNVTVTFLYVNAIEGWRIV